VHKGRAERTEWTPARIVVVLVLLSALAVVGAFVVRRLDVSGPDPWKPPAGYDEVQRLDVGNGATIHIWLDGSDVG
jgi:hypothetical protein